MGFLRCTNLTRSQKSERSRVHFLTLVGVDPAISLLGAHSKCTVRSKQSDTNLEKPLGVDCERTIPSWPVQNCCLAYVKRFQYADLTCSCSPVQHSDMPAYFANNEEYPFFPRVEPSLLLIFDVARKFDISTDEF